MSNRNRNFNNASGNIVDDVNVRDGQAQPVEGERPLPPAEPPRGGLISNFLNYHFTVGGVVKGILAVTAVGVAYNVGKKKGRKYAQSEYQANEYEADYRQIPDDESE